MSFVPYKCFFVECRAFVLPRNGVVKFYGNQGEGGVKEEGNKLLYFSISNDVELDFFVIRTNLSLNFESQ